MKMKKISLITLCCTVLSVWASAQTIVIALDTACLPAVYVDKQRVANGQQYQLEVGNIDNLRFFFTNAAPGVTPMVRLQGMSGRFNELVQPLFEKANPLTAGDLGKSFPAITKSALLQPFRVMVSCGRPTDPVFFCTFVPLPAAPQQPVIGGAQTGGPVTPTMAAQSNAQPAEAIYRPGSAVYDALKLADAANLSQDDLKRIVQFYYPGQDINDTTKAMAFLRQNPFIRTVPVKAGKQEFLATTESGGSLFSQLSLSSIGGLDVTNLVDGLAKFLVKRTKEELSTAFFEKFKTELDKYADLKTLFPKTYNLLAAIGTEVYNYEKYIQNLREAFKDDIETLYENLPGIIPNHPAFFGRHQGLAASLRSGCYLVGALQQQVHPGDVLANYPVEYLDSVNRNWKGSIQTLQLLSASMRDTTGADNNYWVNIKYLRQLVNTKNAFVIYLGLVYQMANTLYDKVPFEKGTLVGLLDNVAPRIANANDIYNAYSTYILRFGEKTDALNNMIAGYTKPANDSLALELYKKYFDAAQDMIDYAAQVGQLPLLNRVKFLGELPQLLQPYFKVTNLTTDLIIEINRKNYSAAINNAVLLYDYVRHKPAAQDMAQLRAAQNTDAPAMATASADSISTGSALTTLARYGAFMSAMATAKTSDEVASVIETFALPAGSSRIKRQTDFNVALNAYVGPYMGGEYLTALKKNATSLSAGLTAPVGVAFSWGNKGRMEARKNGKLPGKKSLTLFVPLIDIGTATAFRFGNDSSSLTSTIQLKNILAPGLYVYYGLGKCPISIGLGAQMGPQLRNISATDIKVDKKAYIRYGITVAVDLPLLNFFTRND
jgi:hypothetical protein